MGCELGPQQAFSFSLLLSSLCCEPGFISCIICSLNKQAHSWPAFKPTHLASAHRGAQGKRGKKQISKGTLYSELRCENLVGLIPKRCTLAYQTHNNRHFPHCLDSEICTGGVYRSQTRVTVMRSSFFRLKYFSFFFFFFTIIAEVWSSIKMM